MAGAEWNLERKSGARCVKDTYILSLNKHEK